MPQKKVIFYFYTRNATFIQKDLAILRSEFEVLECVFAAEEKWKTPFLFVYQLLFLLRNIFSWSRAVAMAQFAGYHTFIPTLWGKILGRRTILVVGGTDCVAFPSLRYGHFQNKLLAWFTRQSYMWASVVSAVHATLFYREDHYYLPEESKQGILHFVPGASFEKSTISNGFDAGIFRIQQPWHHRMPLSFISISASLDDPIRMKLKGIDLILDLAVRMPEANFTLIGAMNPAGMVVPENVKLVPYVPNAELAPWYNQHRFYLQLSISEGFPNALCEAMACGCVPMVSAVASMPEIVGGNGLVVAKRDPELLACSVRDFVFRTDLPQISEWASNSILERFGIEARGRLLVNLIAR